MKQGSNADCFFFSHAIILVELEATADKIEVVMVETEANYSLLKCLFWIDGVKVLEETLKLFELIASMELLFRHSCSYYCIFFV